LHKSHFNKQRGICNNDMIGSYVSVAFPRSFWNCAQSRSSDLLPYPGSLPVL